MRESEGDIEMTFISCLVLLLYFEILTAPQNAARSSNGTAPVGEKKGRKDPPQAVFGRCTWDLEFSDLYTVHPSR